ncbi:ABC transporter ATP-binding protein [Amycolatopsis taiwanensis]|uniref:ABC transporter ATP-binding protein n=1 Tax=Amycolatopsis taiwanensis TaxID=342230 RepID=A0A9W6VKT1_9PSEU|nr:ABC transporter ATP-binding protein [Amycolatopsis taiwanensis]
MRAVDGLDLSLRRGETVALLGANGAGKSTTVNLLLGLLTPSAGRVSVLGGRPGEAVAAGRVGVMLQDGGLMPGVAVAELIGLARALYPRPRPLARLLADAGLTDLARRRVDRLSGGQYQRLRFAIAVAGDPDLLVLDEPTTAMDVASRRAFWAGIQEYAASGKTILFATHYLEEADENADRIVVIAAGKVVADGTPGRIKAAAGGRVVRFTLGDDDCAGLDRLPGVTAVEIHGPAAILHTTDAEATVRALFAGRDRVPDIEVAGTNLEDAVLALTS